MMKTTLTNREKNLIELISYFAGWEFTGRSFTQQNLTFFALHHDEEVSIPRKLTTKDALRMVMTIEREIIMKEAVKDQQRKARELFGIDHLTLQDGE